MSNVNDLIAHLQQLVKDDPSVGTLPFYSNSPMDAEYVFSGSHTAVSVQDVYETDHDTFIDPDSVPSDEQATTIRAVVFDTH